MSEPLTTRLTIHTHPDSDRISWSLLTYQGHKPNHVRMQLQVWGVVSRFDAEASGLDAVAQLLARAARQEA